MSAIASKTSATALTVGTEAPDFSAEDDSGKTLALSDYKGTPLVLYFYPKDNTPGCTTEAEDFRDAYNDFKKLGVEILGVSKDSVKKHCNFREKLSLPFPLLSDEEDSICERYGVWGEKKMYGKTFMGITRTTFLIDGQGVIREIWPKVKVKGHVEDVLAKADELFS